MTKALIQVENLSKTYRVPQRAPGLKASVQSLFKPNVQDVPAVKEISFEIQAGEMVGFIGPNGAGKTTTLKMLAGLLYPTSGTAQAAGFIPWLRQAEYLSQMCMVMGNRNQMLWDIPPLDSFKVLQKMYRVSDADYQQNLDELIDLLEMEEVLKKPVRNLSLGERMKCELVAGLLYRPRLMFLDEPTLGLDVSMQRRLRQFFKEYNQKSGVTVMLTSHYMADVAELCPRVILIHRGELLYDGSLEGLSEKLSPFKLVKIQLVVQPPGVKYTVKVDGRKVHGNILRVKPSKTEMHIEVEAPGYDTWNVEMTPEVSGHLQVSLVRSISADARPSSRSASVPTKPKKKAKSKRKGRTPPRKKQVPKDKVRFNDLND